MAHRQNPAAMAPMTFSLMGHGVPGGAAVPPASKKQKLMNGSPASSGVALDEVLSDDDMSGRDGGKAAVGSKLTSEAKRSQHCEVEKRRRERMNRYMNELAQMIPTCAAVPRRLDKLSILKMAVDHMKSLRGDPHSASEHRPGFLSDDELKHLVVEAANGFMVIIECSWARVLFVSDTISDVLGEPPDNWMGTSFYDLLHPKDVQKVKSQLACFDLEEALKSSVKNNASASPLVMHGKSMNGLRRSFLCRVKRTAPSDQTTSGESSGTNSVDYQRSEAVIRLLQSSQQNIEQQYAVLHCTGFIRNLTSSEQEALKMEEGSSGACLIAVARLQHFGDGSPRTTMEASENEFVARVGTDGRYTYVDPRVVGVLGYLPQDLIGQVSYEYYHPEDIQKMVQLQHDAMKRRTPMPTVQYRFLSKKQKWVCLAMKAFSFINPFSQEVEYVVCTNIAMRLSVCGSDTSEPLTVVTSRDTSEPLPPAFPATSTLPSSSALPSSAPSTLPSSTASASLPSTSTTVERYSGSSTALPVASQGGQMAAGVPLSSVAGGEDDPLSVLFPDLVAEVMQHAGGALGPSSASSEMLSWPQSSQPALSSAPLTSTYSLPPPTPIFTSPANTSLEENAATAQMVLEQYQQQTAAPPHRRDMNVDFPPGLFPPESEVDLEGSHQAYQILREGLEDPSQFMELFSQVEADPFRQQHMLGDIDFDILD